MVETLLPIAPLLEVEITSNLACHFCLKRRSKTSSISSGTGIAGGELQNSVRSPILEVTDGFYNVLVFKDVYM